MRCTNLFGGVARALVCAAGFFSLALPAKAVAIVFSDGGVHTVNTSITPDSVEIQGTTTVNVDAGAVIGSTGGSSISVRNNGVLVMSGGQLNDELFLFNSGTATVNGGTIADDITTNDSSSVIVNGVTNNDDLEARGNSLMTINGGNHDEDIESFDTATVNIHGGNFQTGTDGANVEAAGSSVVNIYGGNFGTGQTDNAGYFGAIENATINIYGADISGQPEGLLTSGSGVINVFGLGGQPAAINTTAGGSIHFQEGSLQNLVALGPGVKISGTDGSLASIVAEDSSVIRIVGKDFKAFNGALNVPFGPLAFASGNLSGVLADGTPITNVSFSRNLLAGGTRGVIILVPEPSTLAIALLPLVGALACRRR